MENSGKILKNHKNSIKETKDQDKKKKTYLNKS